MVLKPLAALSLQTLRTCWKSWFLLYMLKISLYVSNLVQSIIILWFCENSINTEHGHNGWSAPMMQEVVPEISKSKMFRGTLMPMIFFPWCYNYLAEIWDKQFFLNINYTYSKSRTSSKEWHNFRGYIWNSCLSICLLVHKPVSLNTITFEGVINLMALII